MKSEAPKTSARADSTQAPVEIEEAAPLVVAKTGAGKTKDKEDKKCSIIYKDDEETRFLLGRKLDYANTLANVCMLWWVSSLVFSGSIFAAVWSEKEKLVGRPIIHLLGIFLSLFFLGVAVFGAQITWRYLPNLREDLSSLPKKADGKNFLTTELSTFQRSMTFGTISFFFILLFWIIFWIGLARRWW